MGGRIVSTVYQRPSAMRLTLLETLRFAALFDSFAEQPFLVNDFRQLIFPFETLQAS